MHARFAPIPDMSMRSSRTPLRAISGLWHRSKLALKTRRSKGCKILSRRPRIVLTAKMLDYNERTANFAFVEPEREYGPAPFGRHIACTIC